MLDGEEYFTCACSSFDHTLRFVLDLDRDSKHPYPSIFSEIRLSHYYPWYKRIPLAIKYILGIDIRHSHDCWEINKKGDDIGRMISMLVQLRDEIEAPKIEDENKLSKPLDKPE